MDLNNKATVEQIVKGCIKGDKKCQHLLYKTFYGKMLSICCRYTSNNDEAKDLLQDAFIKVFQRLKSFENKGSLEGWVRRIVVNNAIDFVRAKREFLISIEDFSQKDTITDEEENVIELQHFNKIKADAIIALIQKLTPAYKAVFNLYVIEEYSHKEIAEMLGISIGSSKSNLSKAKEKLKQMFEKHYNNIEE
jgi:RNA polymerase sigma-70 factor (ECF subfamily)